MCSIDWRLLLDYLKVILSWPFMGTALVVFIVLLFRQDLVKLIARVKHVKTPFGELETSQQQKLENADEGKVPPPPETPDVDEVRLDQAQIQDLRQWFEAERAARYIWEYRYLNYFFAPTTQYVLDWLVGLGQVTTRSAYDAYWTPLIPNAGERQAVINALQTHYLIELDGGGNVIKLSEKGKEYAAWEGRQILFTPRTPTAE